MTDFASPAAAGGLDLPADVAAALVDPMAHAEFHRVHAAYTWARAHNPLGRARVDGFDPFWVVSKHADIVAVGRDSATFRNADRSSVVFPKAAIAQIEAMFGRPNLTETLVALDDPVHRKLRGITQNWFMPKSVLQVEARVRAIAESSVAKLREQGGSCDFVGDVALHYPLRVVMDVLGVPPEDEPLMLKLTQEMFSAEDPELSRDARAALDPAEQIRQLSQIMGDFGRYFAALAAERLREPRNDIATLLATAQVDGQPLSDSVRLDYFLIIATAGHDTTSSSTATAMWALARDPELLPRLKAEPALIANLIDEAIRWGTPVRHFMRTATVDTELRGRRIAKGDWLMLCYASGNRDEEVFEQPFQFRLDRPLNRHVAFGGGPHVCLGQHLARLEMRTLFEALLPQLESVELAGDFAWSASNFVSGPKRLPIRYRMAG